MANFIKATVNGHPCLINLDQVVIIQPSESINNPFCEAVLPNGDIVSIEGSYQSFRDSLTQEKS